MKEMLTPIRPWLRPTVDMMQACFGRTSLMDDPRRLKTCIPEERSASVHDELIRLNLTAGLENRLTLARLLWQEAVRNQRPTLWFLRRFSPEASLIFLLCTASMVPSKDILSGELTDGQFNGLTAALARLVDARLVLGKVRGAGEFERILATACQTHATTFGVCDWKLSASERRATRQCGALLLTPSQSRR